MTSPYIFFDQSYVSAERAAQVRSWRVNDEMTWRAVAQAATDAWGSDHGSNQLFGEELCRAAAVMLGEDPSSEPWNQIVAHSIDERLIGHWSSLAFSYGVMEATDLGFLGDGRGWSAVYNAYELTVTRFRWNCPQPGLLELRAEWLVQGESVPQPGRPMFAATQPPEPWTHVTRHHYRLGQEAPAPGAAPLPAVLFEEHVDYAHALERGSREISIEDDPSYQVLPYTLP